MRAIFAITLITFKEGVRHRIIFGVTFAAVLLVFLSVFGAGLFMRDILKVLLDISLSATSIAGLLIPFFYTITQFSGDIEKKTIYSILSRVVSRSQYILGRFCGVSLLTFVLMAILLGSTFASILLAKTLYPEHFFEKLNTLIIITASLSSFLSISVLNAVAIFWGSATTSSFLATLLTLGTYMIGQTIEDLVQFALTNSESINMTPTTTIFLKTVMYIFPNFASFDLKQNAAHGLNVNNQDLMLLLVYAAAYCSVMLLCSILLFKKRDL